MLRTKLFPQVLQQANTNGVACTMVSTLEGALIAYAGEKNEKDVAAISASIWSSYEKIATSLSDELSIVIMHNEKGSVAVTRVAKFLLCIVAKEGTDLGTLKHKAQVLGAYLATSLKNVAV